MSERLLLIEDERAQRMALSQYLSDAGFVNDAVESAEEALEHLSRTDYGCLITDLRLPGLSGLELIRRARQIDEELGCLLVTAYASVDSAIEALRLGAHDYLTKPLIFEDVERKVSHLLSHRALLQENARLRSAIQRAPEIELIAESAAMQPVIQWVQRAARTRSPVLITGETGTGKEIVARSIHALSPEHDEPFLAVNLSAVPPNMVASELFGHERGSFTGAEKRRDGVLRAAGRGTVFLDEIGELSPAVQIQLLRALENHEVQPLGSDRAARFQARVLTATHRDLEAAIDTGDLREDLFYRINVLRISIPPLHKRLEDIPILAHQLLERHACRARLPTPVLSAEAIRALTAHRWRGNVRELSNILERALILSDGARVELTHLPSDIAGDAEPVDTWNLKHAVERFERAHIASALRLCEGNRERVAQTLGLSLATLYRRLDHLGLKGVEVHRGEKHHDGADKK